MERNFSTYSLPYNGGDAQDARAHEQHFAAGRLEGYHYCSEYTRAQALFATHLTARQDCDYL